MPPPHHHHRLAIYHHWSSATALNPYLYTTTDPYPYTTTATIYHHRCHILPPYIHHQSEFFSYSVGFRDPYIFRFVFPCLSRSRKKKSLETPGQFLGQNFGNQKYFFPILFLGPRERFETLAIIVIFCRTFSSSLPWFPKKNSQKILCPSCQFDLGRVLRHSPL